MTSSENPLVSTIVPVYNGVDSLEATVASLLAQSYPSHEIVLVDDGSTDGSKNLLAQLSTHPSIIAVSKPNGGVGDARNFGVAHATGSLIAFCDQDDTWEPEKLAAQVPLFDRPEVGLVFSGVRTVYPDREVVGLPAIARPALADILAQNRISCCTAVVRRELFDAVGGFDADRVMAGVDDWHLWLRLLQHCEADSVAESLATHYIHGDNYSLREQTMLEASLLCLSKLEASTHASPIPRSQLRDARRRVYEHYARNLLHNSDFRSAGRCFLNAGVLRPTRLFNLAAAAALLLSPTALLRALQRRKRAYAGGG